MHILYLYTYIFVYIYIIKVYLFIYFRQIHLCHRNVCYAAYTYIDMTCHTHTISLVEYAFVIATRNLEELIITLQSPFFL